MIIEGYSYEIFKQISPQKIRFYLASCGWIPDGRTKAHDIYRSPDQSVVVTVPNSRDYIDYPYRVEEIVRDVSEYQKISVQRVVAGMTISASTDIMEYHYEPGISSIISPEPAGSGRCLVHTGITFPDGDELHIVMKEIEGGRILTDEAYTLMHLSYDCSDPSEYPETLISVLQKEGASLEDGKIVVDCDGDVNRCLSRMIRAILRTEFTIEHEYRQSS